MWWDYIVGYICGGHEWVEAGVVRRVYGVCCAVGMCVVIDKRLEAKHFKP